jgi:hypothetical protein
MRLLVLRITLAVIIAFQVLLGFAFLFFPAPFAASVGLSTTPAWVPWMFAMFTARAWGFAAGLALAMRNPLRHRAWIVIMIGVQAIDWLATVFFVATGAVTLAQVSTASFMPVLFIVALALTLPRTAAAQPTRA